MDERSRRPHWRQPVNHQQKRGEEIEPGDNASVENRSAGELSICIRTGDGARMEMELAPGQAVEVVAGESAARVELLKGEVTDLLVVKPDTP